VWISKDIQHIII